MSSKFTFSRETPQEGLEIIKGFEGLSLKKYFDVAGIATIGYGHRLYPGETFTEISQAQAEAILIKDIRNAERSVNRNINAVLTDPQYAALVSFTFNVGGAALQRSTLRMKINRLEYQDAAQEFFKWIYAGGRKIPALMRRRRMEYNLFMEGTIVDFSEQLDIAEATVELENISAQSKPGWMRSIARLLLAK